MSNAETGRTGGYRACTELTVPVPDMLQQVKRVVEPAWMPSSGLGPTVSATSTSVCSSAAVSVLTVANDLALA